MRIRTMGALVILLVCLISTVALADESYLCIGEHATGFAFNGKNKTWSTARFPPHKWIVKKSTNPKYKLEIVEFGEEYPTLKCDTDFNDSGNLICLDTGGEGWGQFRMSKNNLRYLWAYPYGYWSDTNEVKALKEGANTPLMEIGKCSKI